MPRRNRHIPKPVLNSEARRTLAERMDENGRLKPLPYRPLPKNRKPKLKQKPNRHTIRHNKT